MRDLPTGTVTFLFTDIEGSTRLLHELGARRASAPDSRDLRATRRCGGGHPGGERLGHLPGGRERSGRRPEGKEEGRSRRGNACGSEPLGSMAATVGRRAAPDRHGRTPRRGRSGRRLRRSHPPSAAAPPYAGRYEPGSPAAEDDLEHEPAAPGELQQVLARIEQGARLLTLSGPGGSGKTRLALEVAATLVPEYKAGVFWVGLASLRRSRARDGDDLADARRQGRPRRAHRRGETLVLLDNLEQVIEAAPELSALLSVCPNLSSVSRTSVTGCWRRGGEALRCDLAPSSWPLWAITASRR
jgi:hypothetical protein